MDLGIDLGATSVRVGWRAPDGTLRLAPAEGGGTAAPAAVWYAGPAEVRVGRAALEGLATHPDQVVPSVRGALLGEDSTRGGGWYFHGRFVTPASAASEVYSDAVRRVRGSAGAPDRAVIGIPATAGRRGELRLNEAAGLANLPRRQGIAEPIAAALHYGAVQDGVDMQVVVCDVGGRTLDVSVLRIRDLTVETCHTAVAPLGGQAWDGALADELLAQALRAEPGLAGMAEETLRTAALRTAEELRIALASAPHAGGLLRAGSAAAEVRLDQDQLASLGEDVLAGTVAAVRAGLDSVADRPDTVLLAGAASQLPLIAAAIGDRLGLEVRQQNPELAVVSGLTLAAGLSLLYAPGTAAPPTARPAAAARPVTRLDPGTQLGPGAARRDDPDPVVRDPDPRARPAAPPGPGRATAGPEGAGTAAGPGDCDPEPAAAPRAQDHTGQDPQGQDDQDRDHDHRDHDHRDQGQPDRGHPGQGPPGQGRAEEDRVSPPRPDPGYQGPVQVPADQLRAQPVAQLNGLRRGEHLLLTWIWPDDSQTARVQWQHDGDGGPQGPPGSAQCARRVYDHDGGFDLVIGRGGATVTVDALVPGDEPEDQPPSSWHAEPLPPVVTYDPAVRWRPRRSQVTVTFVSDSDCELPAASLVLGTGSYRPRSIRDGTVLMELPRQPLIARQPAVVRTEIDSVRGSCWLVCLLADDDPAGPELRPLALHRLRVR